MSNQTIILIPDRLQSPAKIEQDVLGQSTQILTPCARDSSEISDETWSSCDAILAWHELQYSENIIKKLSRCKVIVRIGVGIDNVDIEAAGRQGIMVCNVPDYGTTDVADHTMGMILSLSRGIYAYSELLRTDRDNWYWEAAGELLRLSERRLGIIGLGRIGTAVALRAKAFGMSVSFYDPYIPDGKDKALDLTRYDDLFNLLANADVVSIHTPLTSETYRMANAAFFSQLKQNAILINTARGKIVDFDALMDVLKSGRLMAAGLDVLPEEPLNTDHPLIRDWQARKEWIAYRLIITPHSAFFCNEAYREMRMKAALEAKRVLEGKMPRNCVNADYLPK